MPGPLPQTVARVSDFTQSIGVCAHIGAAGTPYADIPAIEGLLSYIGVNHVRAAGPGLSNIASFRTLGAAGVKFDFIVESDPRNYMAAFDALAPYIQSIEGPNEVNHTPVTYNGLTGPKAVVELQKALYAAVHADANLNGNGRSTPVLNFTLAPGGDVSWYGDTSAYADYSNIHSYARTGASAAWFLPVLMSQVGVSHGLPFVVSEMGNYTMIDNGNGVTDAVQAKLITFGILDAFKAGVVSNYVYQLQDAYADPGNTDAEQHFGMFNVDGTPKASAVALHALTTILADTGSTAATFTPAALSYSVTGLNFFGNQLALAKSDGSYDIAVWQEPRIWNYMTSTEIAIAPSAVTVTLGRVYQVVNVYDPLQGTAPIATYHDVNAVQLSLGSDALIVEVAADAPGHYIATGDAGGSFASTSADTVVAGAGNATVSVLHNATVTGSTGTLQLRLSGGGASVTGGAGALSIANSGSFQTVTGGTGAFGFSDTGGNNTVTTGTSASNTVTLGAGRDTVSLRGATRLTLGSGQAAISIGSGGSTIVGGSGVLTLADTVGGNTITGGTGALVLTRGAGSDVINANAAWGNKVTLGAGNDTVNVAGVSTVTGGAGAGLVTLNGSSNVVAASTVAGAGRFAVVDNGRANTITGGSGTFSYTGTAAALGSTSRSPGSRVTLGSGGSTLVLGGTAAIIGSTGTASVQLDASGNSVTGGSGALTVTANAGTSTVVGGTGAFSFTSRGGSTLVTTGRSGSNTVRLGSGNDTVNVVGATSLTAGSGTATVSLASSGSNVVGSTGSLVLADSRGGNTITGGSGALTATVSAGGDVITTHNTSGASVITLGTGRDTITAFGATSVNGGAADVVVGGPAALSVNGGTGSMTVNGGAGADWVFTQANTHNVINLGTGTGNFVVGHGYDTISASTATGAGASRVYVGLAATITGGAGTMYVNGSGRMSVLGGTGAVTATAASSGSYVQGGSNGGNVLAATAGNTTLVGGGAGDRLSDTGTAGGNLLRAGAGGATLSAGSGNDTLVGAGGADVFVLTRAASTHATVIEGYAKGTDRLGFAGFANNAAAIASQRVSGGDLQLTLTDTSTVTLVGVSSL